MTSSDPLAQQVIELIATKRHLPIEQVSPDATFADLGIDSLAGMDLLFDFEETFNLSIPDEIAREMRTVGQAVEAIRAAKAKAAEPPSAV